MIAVPRRTPEEAADLDRQYWAARLIRALSAYESKQDAQEVREHFAGDAQAVADLDARIHVIETGERRSAMYAAGVLLPKRDLDAIALDQGLQDTQALAVARKWHQQEGNDVRPWLVLLGPPGVGKTFAAAWAIAATLRDKGRVIRAAELVQLAYPNYRDQTDGRGDTGRPGVLEDLGTEHAEARFGPALLEFFEHRLNTATIVTSNLSSRDLRERYDGRLIDRMRDRGVVVELGGASMRRQDGGL